MKMIQLTQDEYDLILERRKAMEDENARQANIAHGRALMIEGFNLILDNGGKVSIMGGTYVRSGAFLTKIMETKRGILFEHNK